MEPYAKLFNLILKWQKAEKKWMDGEFLKLESEAITSEADEFWREIFKGLFVKFNEIVIFWLFCKVFT